MLANPFKVYVQHGHVIVEDPTDNHRVYVDDISNAEGLSVEALVEDTHTCAMFVRESRQVERTLETMELYPSVEACSLNEEYRWQHTDMEGIASVHQL